MEVAALPRRHAEAPLRVAAPLGEGREPRPRTVVEALDEGEVDQELGPRGDLVHVLPARTARADAARLEGGLGDPHAGGDVDRGGHRPMVPRRRTRRGERADRT